MREPLVINWDHKIDNLIFAHHTSLIRQDTLTQEITKKDLADARYNPRRWRPCSWIYENWNRAVKGEQKTKDKTTSINELPMKKSSQDDEEE